VPTVAPIRLPATRQRDPGASKIVGITRKVDIIENYGARQSGCVNADRM